jgi:hypothetical protein
MKKLIIGITAFVLITTAVTLWWIYNSLDSQVASAICRYGSKITDVPISLSSTHIAIADGRAILHGLVVGNPDGTTPACPVTG